MLDQNLMLRALMLLIAISATILGIKSKIGKAIAFIVILLAIMLGEALKR